MSKTPVAPAPEIPLVPVSMLAAYLHQQMKELMAIDLYASDEEDEGKDVK